MEQLIEKLRASNLIDDVENIILERYDNGAYQAIDVLTFQQFFGMTDYSYTALVAADQGKGYIRFFDEWKAQGIL
jgi:hypothetical protein